jgi:YHS domain-containing protein
MSDVNTLISRIDQVIKAEVSRKETAWREQARADRERDARLKRYEALAQHLIDLLKPRLAAFIERFKPVVKAEPTVHEHTRAMSLMFAATVAKVNLLFELFPDEDVSHVRLECTQEIVPVLVRYDKHSVLELPLDQVEDEKVIQWFDERIVAFVRVYMAVLEQDAAEQEHLKDYLVEDPVTRVRFPRYLASSTLERNGRTYYFADEESRREFEKGQPA